MEKKIKAINIEWDVDYPEDLENLPQEIEIPNGIEDDDEISDYISDYTGFCHKGFEIVLCEIKRAEICKEELE